MIRTFTLIVVLLVVIVLFGCNNTIPELPTPPWEEPPASPADLLAEVISESEIRLTWHDSAWNENGFEIEEMVDGVGNFSVVDSTSMDVNFLTLRDRQTETTYYHRVRAFNDYGYSDYSNSVSAALILNAPANLQAERIGATSIRLTWEDQSDCEDGYGIEESAGNQNSFQQIAQTTAGVTTVTLENRNDPTTYYYRVRAINELGNSEYSNVVSITLTAPNAPSNLQAERIGQTSIRLTWRDNSDDEDGFEIEESVGDADNFEKVETTDANDTDIDLTGRDFTNRTLYYRVRSLNNIGYSTYTTVVSLSVQTIAFVADGSSIQIIDVSVPTSPQGRGYYREQGGGDIRGVSVVDNYCFMVGIDTHFKTIDVTELSSPQQIGLYELVEPGYNLFTKNGYAYIANHSGGFQIIDISNPSSPNWTGGLDTPSYALDIHIADDIAFIADASSGIQIVDVSNPESPYFMASMETPGSAFGIFVNQTLAFIADHTQGLQIIDISDPTLPEIIGSHNVQSDAWDVFVRDEYAYVAGTSVGLQIFNITDPRYPYWVGNCDTPGFVYDVHVIGDYAYAADGPNGLQIIDVSSPSNPLLVGSYNTPGDAHCVFVVEYW